ncbi:MAG: 3-oxoacyl-ACP reductase FabG [Actinomycetota bacterium]|nr:3-oxoacyl-ACP reductase FabG [Actinomycetota bacterium]
MANMNDQVALVTGGSRGIGRAICTRLLDRGLRVAAGYARSEDKAKELIDEYGEDVVSIHQGNTGDHEDCERVIQEVVDRHGQIDVLVNNAGMNIDKPVSKMTPEDWDRVLQVNLSGAFYLCRAALPHMADRGYGRIINMSSVVGERGNVGQANYAAAKSGLFGLTMTLARETVSKGITVNAVAPGFIETDMVADIPDEALDKIIKQIPAGRLGQPEEVARVVEFLADPDSGYITGAVYTVNGGLYM